MRFLLAFLLAFLPQARVPGPGGAAASGGGGISVVGSQSCYTNSSATCTTSNAALSIQINDTIHLFAFGSGGGCPAIGISPSNPSVGTFSAVAPSGITPSPCSTNQWAGDAAAEMFTLTATSSGSVTLSVGFASAGSYQQGFLAIQIRPPSSSLSVDVKSYNDATSSGPTTALLVPHTGTVTTNHSPEIIVMGAVFASGTPTATASGCFGSTGTVPANGTTSISALQYVIEPTTVTGACEFTLPVSGPTYASLMASYY